MSVRVINADVMEGLRQLPDESVHCVVTSPPYWGLRDYGAEGQIGLEPTFHEHLGKLVEVFREVRRVLRAGGTLWLNYGDAYANDGKWGGETGGKQGYLDAASRKRVGREKRRTGLKPKDLMLMPERLAIALQDDGWWVRSRIIWHKPNPLPESVTDRPTKSHEHIWLLTKSATYFYDADAIKEGAEYVGPNSPASQASPYGQGFTRRAQQIGDKGNANGFRGGSYVDGVPGKRTRRGNVKAGKNEAFTDRRVSGFNARWDEKEDAGEAPLSRNCRDVWTIATVPFPDSHFATFPPELAERCIKAACPKGGTVLDPFGGAGTTGLVADRLQRNAILIELNPEYAAMAERRINRDRGALLDMMEQPA